MRENNDRFGLHERRQQRNPVSLYAGIRVWRMDTDQVKIPQAPQASEPVPAYLHEVLSIQSILRDCDMEGAVSGRDATTVSC